MSEAELASHLESLVCHERPWRILVGSSIGNVGLWRVGGVALCSAQRAARFSFDGSLHRSAAAYHYLMLHDAQIFSLHMNERSIARLCEIVRYSPPVLVLTHVASRRKPLPISHASLSSELRQSPAHTIPGFSVAIPVPWPVTFELH